MAAKNLSLDKYQALLRDAGCSVDEVNESQEVAFTDGGLNYMLRIDSDDDGFVEIILPYDLDGNPETSKRYEVCNYIAKSYKLIKCFYMEGAVFVSVEAFVKSADDFKWLLRYSLNSLHVAYESVVEKYPDGV